MINIRKGVFETNSSSMHCLCVSKENDFYDYIPKELTFRVGYYGWENDFLHGPEALGSYLYTAILSYTDDNTIDSYLNYIYECLGNNGCECTFENPGKSINGYDYGIDHSYECEEFLNAIRHSEKRLLRFLFSPESFIITGNDNEDTFFETIGDMNFSKVEVFDKSN